jgi:hypothetical protein
MRPGAWQPPFCLRNTTLKPAKPSWRKPRGLILALPIMQAYTCTIKFLSRAKLREIKAGVDGFMVYDIGMLATMQQVNIAKFLQ